MGRRTSTRVFCFRHRVAFLSQRDQIVEEWRRTLHRTYPNQSQTPFGAGTVAVELCPVHALPSLLVVQLPIDQWAVSHLLRLLLGDSHLRHANSGIEVHAHPFARRRGLDIDIFRFSKVQCSRWVSAASLSSSPRSLSLDVIIAIGLLDSGCVKLWAFDPCTASSNVRRQLSIDSIRSLFSSFADGDRGDQCG